MWLWWFKQQNLCTWLFPDDWDALKQMWRMLDPNGLGHVSVKRFKTFLIYHQSRQFLKTDLFSLGLVAQSKHLRGAKRFKYIVKRINAQWFLKIVIRNPHLRYLLDAGEVDTMTSSKTTVCFTDLIDRRSYSAALTLTRPGPELLHGKITNLVQPNYHGKEYYAIGLEPSIIPKLQSGLPSNTPIVEHHSKDIILRYSSGASLGTRLLLGTVQSKSSTVGGLVFALQSLKEYCQIPVYYRRVNISLYEAVVVPYSSSSSGARAGSGAGDSTNVPVPVGSFKITQTNGSVCVDLQCPPCQYLVLFNIQSVSTARTLKVINNPSNKKTCTVCVRGQNILIITVLLIFPLLLVPS